MEEITPAEPEAYDFRYSVVVTCRAVESNRAIRS
jgi:hypothetical protein